jgi:hypothetical protein
VPLLRAHPAPLAVVLAAFAAVAWVFLFARPEYRSPHGDGHPVDGTAYRAPVSGWTWRGGSPGEMNDGETADYLLGRPDRADLAPARRAAARAGVDPASVRPLRVAHYRPGPHGFAAILAGRGAGGRTCLGFVVPGHGTSFLCPQRQKAFVIATAFPVQHSWVGDGYEMSLLGIASGALRPGTEGENSVTTEWRSGSPRLVRRRLAQDVYQKRGGWWSTFADTLNGDRPWQADVVIRGEHGRLATLPIRMSGPGSRLFVAR